MSKLRKKEIEAENLINSYIAGFGCPPTYSVLADDLGISQTAAFARCRNIRHLMHHHKPTYKELEGFKDEYNKLFEVYHTLKKRVNFCLESCDNNESKNDYAIATDSVRAILTDYPINE